MPMNSPKPRRQLAVLYSFGPHGDETNPYVRLLTSAVAEQVNVQYFSWRRALLGSYDVFHVHWPEALVRRRTLQGRIACRLLLRRLAVSRTAIVRTEHNLRPHESGNLYERILLRLLDRLTTAWIVMNETASVGPLNKLHFIPHGHYMDWYKVGADFPAKRKNRLLMFGLIRPYKGIEELIRAFEALNIDAGFELEVMGKPQNPSYAQELLASVASVPNIVTEFRHIPDNELSRAIAEAALVILPYKAMHNSGALLLALSLGTPVLVPKNDMTDALAAEVGDLWVQRFDSQITPEAILAATTSTSAIEGSPNLSMRDWSKIGVQHVRLYREISNH